MDGGQIRKRGIALGFGFNILDCNRIEGDVRNGVAFIVNHIGSAVFPYLYRRYNVVQKGFVRNEIHYSCDGRAVNAAGIKRSGNHNGQFACDFTYQRLRHVDIALHGLLYIFPVRIILAVKNADAVHSDDIPALEIVHGGTFLNNGFLFIY